ncbi:MAG: M61 family metallopeptidase [Armatimonadetes bacterium]|nr:M61 family metallopeptidase [Armatimonadota bacterium]MBX3109025.1 M61 family metallopeptidase [Fimbriimonadaceae bacterium]
MRFVALMALTTALASPAFARVDYSVRIVKGGDGVQVEMTVPSDGKAFRVQMPNWAPGSYRLANSAQFVADISAQRSSRKVSVTKVDDNTWEVGAGMSGNAVITYTRKTGPLTDRLHLTGPSYYLYAVGRTQEACTLDFSLPEGWRATNGLLEKDGRFVAESYDVMADAPTTIGVFESDFYEVRGVKHEIAYFGGDPSKVDRQKVKETCQKISEAEASFWGGLPFKKYVWHFTVLQSQDGGWGLEHLSSTTIGLAQGFGKGTVSVLAHELFHAWNVKRIRSSVLGPFDYTKLPKTGALWWLEGVTDYYADVILYRYGLYEETDMLGSIVSNVRTTRANDQRMQVSPYDSSYRVGEAANGQGNSAGFGVNYYNTGWLVGICLDIEIRSRTNGKKSLDDVIKGLYEQCRDNKPGFAEGAIRDELVKVGGKEMGPLYDKWVREPGELPVEAQLAKIGYTLQTKVETFGNPGFALSWLADGRLMVGRGARPEGINIGDEVISVDGIAKVADTEAQKEVQARWKAAMAPGKTVHFVFQQGDMTAERDLEVKATTSTSYSVIPDESASPNAVRLRKGWHLGSQ